MESISNSLQKANASDIQKIQNYTPHMDSNYNSLEKSTIDLKGKWRKTRREQIDPQINRIQTFCPERPRILTARTKGPNAPDTLNIDRKNYEIHVIWLLDRTLLCNEPKA